MKPTKTGIQENHTHTWDAVLHTSGYANSLHLLVEAPLGEPLPYDFVPHTDIGWL